MQASRRPQLASRSAAAAAAVVPWHPPTQPAAHRRPGLPGATADPSPSEQQRRNLCLVQQLVPPGSELPRQLLSQPAGLQSSDLADWQDFLLTYGLSRRDLSRLLAACPELFERSNVFECGRTLLLFKALGWRDTDILGRIVPQFPALLARRVEADMLPVLAYLTDDLGCCSANVRLLVWEFPRIFTTSYQRHIRKFQCLGLYGLPPPGATNPAARENRGGGGLIAESALSRLMMFVH